jgi:arylsulfatase A-like enzyme
VVDLALDYLHSGYEVLFIHFPNPDYFGHLTGWMSETYLFELRNTDSQVGRVLDAVEALDLTDETLIILTADHGGHDKTHGSALPEDMRIPWMVAGPGVLPGQTLEIDVHTSATAATVLWTLGLTAPESTVARPVFEAFVSR